MSTDMLQQIGWNDEDEAELWSEPLFQAGSAVVSDNLLEHDQEVKQLENVGAEDVLKTELMHAMQDEFRISLVNPRSKSAPLKRRNADKQTVIPRKRASREEMLRVTSFDPFTELVRGESLEDRQSKLLEAQLLELETDLKDAGIVSSDEETQSGQTSECSNSSFTRRAGDFAKGSEYNSTADMWREVDREVQELMDAQYVSSNLHAIMPTQSAPPMRRAEHKSEAANRLARGLPSGRTRYEEMNVRLRAPGPIRPPRNK